MAMQLVVLAACRPDILQPQLHEERWHHFVLAALAREAPPLTWHLLQFPLGLLVDLWIQLAHLGMSVDKQNSPRQYVGRNKLNKRAAQTYLLSFRKPGTVQVTTYPSLFL